MSVHTRAFGVRGLRALHVEGSRVNFTRLGIEISTKRPECKYVCVCVYLFRCVQVYHMLRNSDLRIFVAKIFLVSDIVTFILKMKKNTRRMMVDRPKPLYRGQGMKERRGVRLKSPRFFSTYLVNPENVRDPRRRSLLFVSSFPVDFSSSPSRQWKRL